MIHAFDNEIQDKILAVTKTPYIQPLAWPRNEMYLAMEAEKENGNIKLTRQPQMSMKVDRVQQLTDALKLKLK